MDEMSNPDSLSPNRLNQALISETLNEFPHFEFVSTNGPEIEEQQTAVRPANPEQDQLVVYPSLSKPGRFLFFYLLPFVLLPCHELECDSLPWCLSTEDDAVKMEQSSKENINTSASCSKQGTPPILRRGNRRRGRADSSSYDVTGQVFLPRVFVLSSPIFWALSNKF